MATTNKTEAKSSWDQKVKIRLPKATDGGENFVIASVNFRDFKIQRGVEVEVPAPIAEVLQHSFEAEEEADAYLESLNK